jgi:hypothetical protein
MVFLSFWVVCRPPHQGKTLFAALTHEMMPRLNSGPAFSVSRVVFLSKLRELFIRDDGFMVSAGTALMVRMRIHN